MPEPEENRWWARLFVRHDLPVVPLRYPIKVGEQIECSCRKAECSSIGKHPVVFGSMSRHGYKDAILDETRIDAIWKEIPEANIGVCVDPESGLFVVDVDPRNGGLLSLAKLEQELGIVLPQSSMVFTGRCGEDRGRHYWFLYPPGKLKNCSKVKGYPGIELKSHSGYVVAPGSLHSTGVRYTFNTPDGGMPELAQPPQELLDFLFEERLYSPRKPVLTNPTDSTALTNRTSPRFPHSGISQQQLSGNSKISQGFQDNQAWLNQLLSKRNDVNGLHWEDAVFPMKSNDKGGITYAQAKRLVGHCMLYACTVDEVRLVATIIADLARKDGRWDAHHAQGGRTPEEFIAFVIKMYEKVMKQKPDDSDFGFWRHGVTVEFTGEEFLQLQAMPERHAVVVYTLPVLAQCQGKGEADYPLNFHRQYIELATGQRTSNRLLQNVLEKYMKSTKDRSVMFELVSQGLGGAGVFGNERKSSRYRFNRIWPSGRKIAHYEVEEYFGWPSYFGYCQHWYTKELAQLERELYPERFDSPKPSAKAPSSTIQSTQEQEPSSDQALEGSARSEA